MLQRSILGPILPEAMIWYLENYGEEKFAAIYLGEFETPEAIWSSEMRRVMIEKIALHLSDFTPRLQSNVRAPYQVEFSFYFCKSDFLNFQLLFQSIVHVLCTHIL